MIKKSKLFVFLLVLISLIALTVDVYGAEWGEFGTSAGACTDKCHSTYTDPTHHKSNYDFYCCGAGATPSQDCWCQCCIENEQVCTDISGAEQVAACKGGGEGPGGDIPQATCAEGDGCLEDCWYPDPDCPPKFFPVDYTNASACSYNTRKGYDKNLKINESKILAVISSIKVNGEEQLLEGVNISTVGNYSNGKKYYKYFTTARIVCSKIPLSGLTVQIMVNGELVTQTIQQQSPDEEYCYVNISLPVANKNVKVLILDNDLSSNPCAIADAEKSNDTCLDKDTGDINFKTDVLKVSNGVQTLDIKCDQDIMVNPLLKTDSQRWNTVCSSPAAAAIQEYKTGTDEENLRTIFDWQRTDIDQLENPFVLNKQDCQYQEKYLLTPLKTDVTLESAKQRADCGYEPITDKCYWLHVTNGTTLKINVSSATADSFIEIKYKNCDSYCNEANGVPCTYTKDSCSPTPLRDLTCPTSLKDSCDKTGDWLYKPDGSPTCGAIGGLICYSAECPSTVDRWGITYDNIKDLGATFDCPHCCGQEANYCVRGCSVNRTQPELTTYFGNDLPKEYYWGSCPSESCQSGYESKESNSNKKDEYDCNMGCTWDAKCLDCAEQTCENGGQWEGEPKCECKSAIGTEIDGKLVVDNQYCAGANAEGYVDVPEGHLLQIVDNVCYCLRTCNGLNQVVSDSCGCGCEEGTVPAGQNEANGDDVCCPSGQSFSGGACS